MPTPDRHTRFLLRGSLLLIAVLALWWLALQTPMLLALRVSEDVALRLLRGPDTAEPIAGSSSGDWIFSVPVQDSAPDSPPGAASLHSVEFTMQRSDLVLFTFSVPFYWAIALAGFRRKPDLRALLWGTALVALAEVLSLLVFVEISAHSVVAPWHPAGGAWTHWWREAASYLLINVIPFFAPLLIAIALHPQLRAQVLPWAPVPSPAGRGPASQGKPGKQQRSAGKSSLI